MHCNEQAAWRRRPVDVFRKSMSLRASLIRASWGRITAWHLDASLMRRTLPWLRNSSLRPDESSLIAQQPRYQMSRAVSQILQSIA